MFLWTRSFTCLGLCLAISCGSMDSTEEPAGNTANNNNANNTASETTNNNTNNTPQKTSVAQLRDGSIPAYTVVTLENVVVTASFGNKKAFYVQEPQQNARAGVLIERCKDCTWAAPLLGSTVSVTGKFFTRNGDMWVSVGPESFTPSTQALSMPQALQVTGDDIKKDGTGGLNALGMRVQLIDGPFIVTSITPSEFLNTGYDASGTGCLKGPQYMGVEVQNAAGAKILLDTSCYRNIDITTSNACSKTARLIELGHTFTKLGGVFDFKQGKRLLIPAETSDYLYDAP
jgi:hypothetical protein